MSRGHTNDQTDDHAGEDGDDRLMDGTDALELEVVGRDKCAYEEYTEDAQAPSEW